MDGLTSAGKRQQSPQCPDIESLIAIPAVLGPDLTDEEWDAELKRMFASSRAAQAFIVGKISPQDFEDTLSDIGFDPYALEDLWSEGESLLVL